MQWTKKGRDLCSRVHKRDDIKERGWAMSGIKCRADAAESPFGNKKERAKEHSQGRRKAKAIHEES